MDVSGLQVESVDDARRLAARYLDVPQFRERRWRHVQAVGAKAERLASAYGADGGLLASAAWLHDIGYSPQLRVSGFHPLDGARLLLNFGTAAKRLAALVANHSGAAVEARLRGLASQMVEFPDEESAVRDALWACDMTTSPVGEPVDFEQRLAEIVDRYGADHTVARAIVASGHEIRSAIKRARQRVDGNGLTW